MENTGKLGLGESESDAVRASAAEFILEGLYAHRRISRNEEQAFAAAERPPRNERAERSSGGASSRGEDRAEAAAI